MVDNGLVDIVAERFDAGVRRGETLAQDLIAVRIGPDMRMAIAASPGNLKTNRSPLGPDDLANHNCINLRHQARVLRAKRSSDLEASNTVTYRKHVAWNCRHDSVSVKNTRE